MSCSAIQELDDESDQISEQMQFSGDENFIFRFDIEQNYLDTSLQHQSEWLCESLMISKQIVQGLLKRSLKRAEERQIVHDIPIHAINYVEYVSGTCSYFCLDYGQGELKDCVMEEDAEPVLIFDDPWRRNNVAVTLKDADAHESQDAVDSLNNSKSYHKEHSVYSVHSRQSMVKQPHESSSKILKVPVLPSEPQPVALLQEIDNDEYQDKLRNAKLYDQKKKLEADQKKQSEKLKMPKPERGEQGPKKYIFDFDGSLLASKALKVEKLNPANYLVGFNVFEPKGVQQDNQPKLKKKRKDLPPDPSDLVPKHKVNNKILEDRKENTKEILGDKSIKPSRDLQFPYENFAMGSGVTLFFESKMKEGQRSQVSDSVEALSSKLAGSNLISSEQLGDRLRLTKTEYQLVTQYGSTHNQSSKQYLNPQSEKHLPTGNPEQSGINANQSTITQKSTKPKLQFLESSSQKSPQPKNSSVKLVNNKFLSKLVGDEDSPLSKLEKQKVSGKVDKVEASMPAKNPIDQFNQTLLQSKDWGKMGQTQYLPPIKSKHSKHIDPLTHKSSLEQLYKLPRERLNAQNKRIFQHENLDQSSEKKQKKLNTKTIDTNLQTFYTTHSKFSERLRYS